MPKKRMIHDCIWSSESVGLLSMRQRVLWVGLITTADDQGRGKAHPGLLRASIFPFDIITQDELVADMERLSQEDMMTLYEVDGKLYYQIANWWEYQSPAWASPSKYPPPENWQDRIRYHGPNRQIITENWGGSTDSLPSAVRSGLPSALPYPQEEEEEEVKEEVKEKEKEGADAPSPASEILSLWIELYPTKPKHRLTDKLKRQATTRMKAKDFREGWAFALKRGSYSKFLSNSGWYDLYWFLKDDDNWRKVAAGNYDDDGAKGMATTQAEPIPESDYVSPDDFFKVGE